MRRDGERAKGWIWRQQVGVSDSQHMLVVQLRVEGVGGKTTFDDTQKGAELARNHITEKLGREDWRMEECGFLGYRIVVPDGESESTVQAQADTLAKLREAMRDLLEHTPHSRFCDSYVRSGGDWKPCDCWKWEAEAALEATK